MVSADASLLALMGASPGASTAAAIALDALSRGFPERMTEARWLPRLREVIPTYGIDLTRDAAACKATRHRTAAALGLATID